MAIVRRMLPHLPALVDPCHLIFCSYPLSLVSHLLLLVTPLRFLLLGCGRLLSFELEHITLRLRLQLDVLLLRALTCFGLPLRVLLGEGERLGAGVLLEIARDPDNASGARTREAGNR